MKASIEGMQESQSQLSDKSQYG
ncbi:hypothetical protein AYI69_g10265, partial [Smittium culicis]